MSNRRSHLTWWAVAICTMALDLLFWGGDTAARAGGSVPGPVVGAAAAAMAAALAFTPQRPVWVYAVAWSYSVGGSLLLLRYGPFTALLVATYYLVGHRPASQAKWFALGTAVPWAINTVDTAVHVEAGPADTAVAAFMWGILTLLVWRGGRYVYQTEELVQSREATLRAQARLSVQQERLRMARELHDIVAHSVSAVLLQAAGAQRVMSEEDPRVRHALQTIEATSAQAMRELRRLLGFLLAPDPDDASEPHSSASLGDLALLVESTRACSVDVRVDERGERRALAPPVEHVAYRVLQEALANVIRHGGSGSRAQVCLVWGSDCLHLAVDSHAGAPPASRGPAEHSGHGLGGLRARVEDLGGAFDSGPTAGGGFRVSAQVPYDS